jgi:hypothetical protein
VGAAKRYCVKRPVLGPKDARLPEAVAHHARLPTGYAPSSVRVALPVPSNADGSDKTNLTNSARDEVDLAWSPDGQKFVMVEGD